MLAGGAELQEGSSEVGGRALTANSVLEDDDPRRSWLGRTNGWTVVQVMRERVDEWPVK